MSTIRAVTVDSESTAHLTLSQVDAPAPAPNEALVRVKAFSLNRGEVRGAQSAKPGTRPGWDIAGVVERQAAGGNGPKEGERVVGLLQTGAWAELLAVPAANLAVLPDAVSFSDASTLPVAGLTALYALDRANGLFGRNVLVTGASGGVGHFGVQMAAQAGARVTGLVRQEKHIDVVKQAGAVFAVADETGAAAKEGGPFNLVLESVGGEVLANAMTMMAPFGQIVCYGTSGSGQAMVDTAYILRSRLEITGLGVFVQVQRETAGVGLARLVHRVAEGTLKPHIALEAPWTDIGEVAQQLLDRSYPGKAVLLVD